MFGISKHGFVFSQYGFFIVSLTTDYGKISVAAADIVNHFLLSAQFLPLRSMSVQPDYPNLSRQ